jgi:hypothetical protein
MMADLTVQARIHMEIYRAFEALGADGKLLAIVGSWGDTLDDDEVLKLLGEWNYGSLREGY